MENENREIPVKNHYLNVKALSGMDKFERDLYTYMYKKLIEYMLSPDDFSHHTREQMEKSTQKTAIDHLYNTLREQDILVNIRELNISKIID